MEANVKLRDWIRAKYLEMGDNKFLMYKKYKDACQELGKEINHESYTRTVREIYNEMFVNDELLECDTRIPKILYFDIETTNLKSDFGEMLMCAYRWEDEEEIKCVSVLDYPKSFDLPVEKRDNIF